MSLGFFASTAALFLATPCLPQTPIASASPASASELERLRARIIGGDLPNIHSLLIEQDGRLIAEWYFKGADEKRGQKLGEVKFDAETLHDIRSVTKSVVSLLVGIALRDGDLKSPDTPVLDYFPEYADLRSPDKMKIRLRDLLQMGSGLEWDEENFSYADPRNSETAMDASPDRYRHILSQKIVSPPGTRFNYSGGDVALVGAVLARATKMPLDVYAAKKLFAPLEITKFDWLKDKSGTHFAASGLRLLPRDMLKIGELMLHGGRWNEKQIVPEDWVKAASTMHAQVEQDPVCSMDYGYFWWVWPGCSSQMPVAWFGAIGNGGQRIWVVPSRQLVVVMTAGLYNDFKATRRNALEVLGATLRATAKR